MPLNILFVTPYVPSTVRVRPYAFIRGLVERGHRVTLACLVQPASEERYLAEISPYCAAVHSRPITRVSSLVRSLLSLPTRQPLSVAYCQQPDFKHLVEGLAAQGGYDVVHTEFIRAAPFTMGLTDKPRVFDAVDSLTLAYRRSLTAAFVPLKQRLFSFIEWAKMRGYEPWVVNHYPCWVVSSPLDQQKLRQFGDGGVVIPNGVDMDYFKWHDGPCQPATILFLGKMNYYVNVASVLWFYREVFPHIRQKRLDAHFMIVGRDPAASIQALAQDPNVTVTGTVPDVRPYLQQATVAVCPMVAGSGIQNKMLEAMASGVPVVSTSLACQALQAVADRDFVLADSPLTFAESVLELLNSGEERRRIAYEGREYVKQHHNWPISVERLEEVYKNTLIGIINAN